MEIFDLRKVAVVIERALKEQITDGLRYELDSLYREIINYSIECNKEIEQDRSNLKEYYETKIKNLESYPFGWFFNRKRIKEIKADLDRLESYSGKK